MAPDPVNGWPPDLSGRFPKHYKTLRGMVRQALAFRQGAGEDAPRILEGESFDAVLCHGVLAHLEAPGPLIRALAEISRPGAIISLITKNAGSLAMRPALKGRYRDALSAFDSDREVGGLGGVTRGYTLSSVSEVLEACGAYLVRWYGIRVFTDPFGDQRPSTDLSDVLEAELEAGRRDSYRSVARLMHLVGREK